MDEQQQIAVTQKYLLRKREQLERYEDRPQTSERDARNLRDLRSMPYKLYLTTAHWQTVRRDALARGRNRCEQCASATMLDVHHVSYDHRGDEAPEDVVVLCRSCHFSTPYAHRKATT